NTARTEGASGRRRHKDECPGAAALRRQEVPTRPARSHPARTGGRRKGERGGGSGERGGSGARAPGGRFRAGGTPAPGGARTPYHRSRQEDMARRAGVDRLPTWPSYATASPLTWNSNDVRIPLGPPLL